jgi:F-type H+-transporting ATPase subunit delta
MPNPRLASRYAKALLEIAIEKGQLEEVFADVSWLHSVCKSNRDFVNLLRSPVINADTKKKIVEAIVGERISVISSGFIRLLITKNREATLPEIFIAFIAQYKEKKGIHIVKLTTAVPANDTVRKAIIDQVSKAGGFANIELEEKVDPSIVGGFVLQVGDKLVDASISYDLREVAKQFENNDFVYKIR